MPSDSWLVQHTNPSGHRFVTRVTAVDDDEAWGMVANAHVDNSIVSITADHGEATHTWDSDPTSDPLEVHTLDQEP